MAGVTDLAFRTICRELGAAYTITEMVSAKALCYQDKKSIPLLQLGEGDTLHPVPQGGLPGPGGRVLHAADSGGLHQRSGGERPVQVVAAQAEGPGLFPSDGHGAASPGAGAS